jgi:hypothetical protein
MSSSYIEALKAPLLEIISSTPTDTATGVPVGQTITLTFSVPLIPSTVTNANLTLSPGNPAKVTTLDPVNHKIVTINPDANLSAATLYTVQARSGLRGAYGSWQLTGTGDSISFTTA